MQQPWWPLRARRLAVLLAIAVAVSLLVSVQWWLHIALVQNPGAPRLPSLRPIFFGELSVWLTLAAMVPAIFWAGSRWPLFEHQWYRSLPIHILLSLLVPLVLVASTHAVRPLIGINYPAPYLRLIWQGYVGTFANFALMYFGVLTLHHSLAYRSALLDREARQFRTEAELSRARLQLLHTQLQPHFLFNTLNTISALVTRDPRSARAMIGDLSELLRTALNRSVAAEIPLEDEIRFSQAYLDIQRRRFRDRLEVEVDVPSDTLAASVPPMVLQPLLENALQHGLPEKGPARVDLRARREGDTLRIIVADRGPGFSPHYREGKGLSAVRALLEHAYGSAFTMSVGNRGACGAAVVLELPVNGRRQVAGDEKEKGRNA